MIDQETCRCCPEKDRRELKVIGKTPKKGLAVVWCPRCDGLEGITVGTKDDG